MTQHTPLRIRADRDLVDAMRSLPPERSVNDYACGCHIIRESAGALFIRWCAMHAAAPHLLQALETMTKAFGNQRFNVRKDFSKMLAIEAAHTAIAKAEPK